MSNELQTTSNHAMTAVEVRAGVNLIQEVMKAVMKNGVHFGTLPGCGDRPTLLKPGAEKILTTFKIAVEPEVIDLSTPDEARYRVVCRGIHMGSGVTVGAGIGEASSSEEKWRWRAAICDEEFNETPEDRRRMKWAKGPNKTTYQKKQVRTDHADLANTVLKMAKKRAQVDLCLTATAASDVFTQDIEDMPEELRPVADETRQPVAMPTPKATKETPPPPAGAKTVTGIIASADPKTGKKTNGDTWTRWRVDVGGVVCGTFDTEMGALAEQLKAAGVKVAMTYQDDGKGHLDILELVAAE